MAEKKIVDDYYSQINKSKGDTTNGKTTRKLVVKAKKVVKKVEKKVEDNKDSSVSFDVKKGKVFKKENREESRKKTNNETNKIVVKRKVIQKIKVVKSSQQQKDEKKLNIKTRGSSQNNKNFGEDKKKQTSYKKTKNQKFNKESGQDNNSRKKQVRNKTRGRFRFFDEAPKDTSFTRSKKADRKKEEKKVEDIKQVLISKTGETVIMGDVFSLKEFSEKIGAPLVKLIAEFMKNGMMVNINSKIDFDSASIIAEIFEVKLEKDTSEGVSVEDLMTGNINDLLIEDDISKLETRPPVISIMGHVDHGKTSLLDRIRKSKIADGEAGGITQSIGAYQVEHEGKKITFLDTPGHEAFTVMRSRGAKATDIAILVVAADEGVKPQTIESISHAKEAGIPVVVAINKMDKEGANPDHIKGQLAEKGLTPEDWGGDTPMVPVSAKDGFGIDELLEIVLLIAEMKELKANPSRSGVATVIESHLDSKLGPVATALINTGTINKGDNIVSNGSFGKIRTMKNHENLGVLKAFPGDPVLIIGLDKVVSGGDIIQVVANPAVAKQKAQEYAQIIAHKEKNKISGLDILMSRIKAGNLKQLKILIKADTNGSLEAIKASVQKLSTPETNALIIHSGVGSITQGDIVMAESSQAILVGFNVGLTNSSKTVLEKSKVEFINSKVIYHITERIEKIITGMLDPKEIEVPLCNAKVGGIFYTDKKFLITGLILSEEDSKIESNSLVRVIRKDKKISEGKITSLKSGIEEVKELTGPTECGVRYESKKLEIEIGDIFEVYKIEIKK